MIMLQKFHSGDFLERFFRVPFGVSRASGNFQFHLLPGFRANGEKSREQLLMIFGDVETLSDSKFACPTNVINKLSSTKTPQTIKFRFSCGKFMRNSVMHGLSGWKINLRSELRPTDFACWLEF